MNLPAVVQRHRSLRWLAPAGVLCVAGLVTTGVLRAGASPAQLPKTTPTALLAAVRSAQVQGFSGTVLSQTSLGLPQLPAVSASSDAGDQTSFMSLLSGSHTLQVWYGGPDKQRVALLGSTDETDVFRNGSDMWEWSSDDQVARHIVLPTHSQHATPLPANPSELTPLDLAQHLLGTLDPTTAVTVGDERSVADRATYQLVLTPRTSATTIGSVRIDVDGSTKVPLAVQVFPRGDSDAAIDVAFTSIRFGAQPERTFQFKPPAGATVKAPPAHQSPPSPSSSVAAPPRTTGSGWATVVGMRVGGKLANSTQHGALDKAFVPVSGTWGSGRLLQSALISVLVTKDGRLFAGAVDPSGLYAAAGTK